MPEEPTENRKLLPDGRVMKGIARIESIVTRYEERLHFAPYTWKCNRMLRREFNALTVKIVLLSGRADKRARIARIISELVHEANHLEQATCLLAAPPASEFSPLPLRLVSPEARQLMDAMIAFDKALAKFTESEGLEAAEQHCSDFFTFYGRLKHCLFGSVEHQA